MEDWYGPEIVSVIKSTYELQTLYLMFRTSMFFILLSLYLVLFYLVFLFYFYLV